LFAELDFDVIVIGAGAAGMMCAAIAGQRGRRAVLVEHAPKLGEKIRISGGGRCNFTNIHCKPENFLSRNPDFCRSALARHTPRDFIALVEKHGIAYWTPGEPIHIDLLPERSGEAILFANRRSRALPATVLAETLPRRFARQWCEAMGAMQPIDQMSDKALRALAEVLHDWQVKPCGTSGYAKAEVTLGGVDTDELSSKTMEAKRVTGLYFIGEVVDVTGQLGGFNFQWAWASGFVAGQSV
jgi:predicted flavoprotein YhiN